MANERGKHFTIKLKMHKSRRGNVMKIATRGKGDTAFALENISVDGIMCKEDAERALRTLMVFIQDKMWEELGGELEGSEERVLQIRAKERESVRKQRLKKLEEE